MIRVVITGVCGRMGRCITRGITQQTDMEPHCGISRNGRHGIGTSIRIKI